MKAVAHPLSPWERALRSEADDLDAGLRSYFSGIPRGSVGRGYGVLDTVGTPRRWIWPILWCLSLDGIAFPVWQQDVPFTVENRPTSAGTIRAVRVFSFRGGDRTMTDEIGITRLGLVDRLGRRGTVSAVLEPQVVAGRLVLRSTGVILHLGGMRVPLGWLSPRVLLIERDAGPVQHVSLQLHVPLIGLVYAYSGSFAYNIAVEA